MIVDLREMVTEEDTALLSAIVNREAGLVAVSFEALDRVRADSIPLIAELCVRLTDDFGLPSEYSLKSATAAADKCARPSTLDRHPWFTPAHLRDYLRFRTYLTEVGDFARVVDVFREQEASGALSFVKIDAHKMLRPGAFGWRMVATDLRLAHTGLIVEHYMTFGDLIHANQEWLHPIYEHWRSRDPDDLTVEEIAVLGRDARLSAHAYRELMMDALTQRPDGNPILRVRRGMAGSALVEFLESVIAMR